MRSLISISFVCLLILSCRTESNVVKDTPQSEKKYGGRAKIVLMKPSMADTNDRDKYMEIYFDFIPENSSDRKNYKYPSYNDTRIRFFYDNRNIFHKNWIARWGMAEGNIYPAARYELINPGKSSPVLYEIFLEPR